MRCERLYVKLFYLYRVLECDGSEVLPEYVSPLLIESDARTLAALTGFNRTPVRYYSAS